MKTRRSITKERSAVVLSIAPSDLATQLFGSAAVANRKLGLRPYAFQEWDRTNRIPKAVYAYLERLEPKVMTSVKVREEQTNGRPYEVPSRLATAAPVRTVKARAVAVTPISTPIAELQKYVTKLETENRQLRNALNAVQTVIRPVAG